MNFPAVGNERNLAFDIHAVAEGRAADDGLGEATIV